MEVAKHHADFISQIESWQFVPHITSTTNDAYVGRSSIPENPPTHIEDRASKAFKKANPARKSIQQVLETPAEVNIERKR